MDSGIKTVEDFGLSPLSLCRSICFRKTRVQGFFHGLLLIPIYKTLKEDCPVFPRQLSKGQKNT